jgi:endonuclease/exonuclease/phosphatase family metal-dependent hydrolase
LNYGLTGPLPDAKLETALPLLKECFTNMRADLLFINECVQYINQGDDGETRKPLYETLLKQFYPHYITSPTEWMGCFSKIRFAMKDIAAPAGGSRTHKFGVMKIDGIDVAIAFVHCSPYNVAERVAELTAIASEFDGYDYGIIVGDTNITNNADTQEQIAQQMQPLLDAGFVFGNMGYWGMIPTLPFNPATPTVAPTMSTDNIIVKGFNIDYFEAFVEKDGSENYQSYYSDHYPIRAEISSIMNT